jgi:hypothetical protein
MVQVLGSGSDSVSAVGLVVTVPVVWSVVWSVVVVLRPSVVVVYPWLQAAAHRMSAQQNNDVRTA